MPSKKALKKLSFATFGSDNTSIEGERLPIVDNDPGFHPCDDEFSNDNTKKKNFTHIIQFIIDLCDFLAIC
jgi:hypothetical protein